ncbi:hypothetical protein BC828DRAFT_379995 [Blastocladiella britannica]|nr:hypothetical protein BC828DRAFT_379995 [Blastocladiella britannica]
MLPLSLLNAAQGHPIRVELKNGESYNGTLVNCDNFMNLNLRDVICTSPDGDRFWTLTSIYLRGMNVKFLHVPDAVLDSVQEDRERALQQRRLNNNNNNNDGGSREGGYQRHQGGGGSGGGGGGRGGYQQRGGYNGGRGGGGGGYQQRGGRGGGGGGGDRGQHGDSGRPPMQQQQQQQ